MTLTRPNSRLAIAVLLAFCGTAQAEDLSGAEPPGANLEQAFCSIYGAGFHAIPGTDTCLRVGGSVRVDSAYVGGDLDADAPNFSTRTRGRARFETRTDTDFGQVRIVIDRDVVLDSADR